MENILHKFLAKNRIRNLKREYSQQDQRLIEKHIRDIAVATLENDGAAFKLDTYLFLPPLDVWAFPKYPSRTAILPSNTDLEDALKDFILTNEQYLREPDCWLGTWIHPNTHEFYLDITTGCEDLDEARKMALEVSRHEGRKVVAIYNSRRRQTVYL